MSNEDYLNGYAIDPSIVYGPATGDRMVADRAPQEHSVLSNAPLEGPTEAESEVGDSLTAGKFIASPAGMLILLLVPAYIAFEMVFRR